MQTFNDKNLLLVAVILRKNQKQGPFFSKRRRIQEQWAYLLLKSPRFHDLMNSFQANGLKIFCGGACP